MRSDTLTESVLVKDIWALRVVLEVVLDELGRLIVNDSDNLRASSCLNVRVGVYKLFL